MMNEKLRVVGGLTRHDARNKLTTITGNAYLARKKLAGNTEVASHLDDIEKAVEQVVRIFEHAKTYEMLGSQDLTQIDVGKAINEAVSLFPDLHDVEIINECRRLTVRADSLLRQLFYNLIDNSFKYGQKLSHIKIHCVHNETELTLVYEDDGTGIPQTAKPMIFEEGFTTGKGSGYGLYLIGKMMEVYGWTIKETGEPGKGVLFAIVIPKIGQDGKENYQLT
jgi:signal transduction histidine kinase